MIKRTNLSNLILPVLYTILLVLIFVNEPYRNIFKQSESEPVINFSEKDTIETTIPKPLNSLYQVPIQQEVPLRTYFDYMDSLVCAYDTLLPYTLDEHLLVRTNDWIIDTLESTDYYRRMAKGQFVYDQRDLIILKKGDTLDIPNIERAAKIIGMRTMTTIDLNIPEFKMRIIEAGKTLHTFPVRVGRNEVKYLAMAKREVDLRTTPGEGKIVRLERYPAYINPADGKRYEQTKRDDGKYTKMPLIPYIEPEINGHRYGELIHPTTNPITLGKAYSNGCVGMKEADTWRVYYYAPIGTKVVFRYDLEIENEKGERIQLDDIYGQKLSLASAISAFLDFRNY